MGGDPALGLSPGSAVLFISHQQWTLHRAQGRPSKCGVADTTRFCMKNHVLHLLWMLILEVSLLTDTLKFVLWGRL